MGWEGDATSGAGAGVDGGRSVKPPAVGMAASGAVEFAIGPILRLQGGGWIDLLDPRSGDFGIEDIAHGLAHLCCHVGQCDAFYSLAEHCVLVSETCPEAPLVALLKDAAKAFLGDLPRPLARLLPAHRRIERNVAEAILGRFGIRTPLSESVVAADLRVLAAEQAQIMPPGAADWAVAAGVTPADVKVRHLPPFCAKREFLDRYEALRSELALFPNGPAT